MSRPLVTLLTDFGLSDGYVAQMKGVIAGIVDAAVVDVSHAVPPQDVMRAAFLIDEVVDAFAADAVHLIVVDPGVGTDRGIVAVETPVGRFVCPDNGLLGVLLDRMSPSLVVDCTDPAWWRPDVSHTFHGRDVMGPLAAHWAAGVDPRRFGSVRKTPLVSLSVAVEPAFVDGAVHGRVLWADHFGNLVTNIRRNHMEAIGGACHVRLGSTDVGPVHQTYGETEPGSTLAHVGSGGRLEIAVNQGNAAERFGWCRGDELAVVVTDSTS